MEIFGLFIKSKWSDDGLWWVKGEHDGAKYTNLVCVQIAQKEDMTALQLTFFKVTVKIAYLCDPITWLRIWRLRKLK